MSNPTPCPHRRTTLGKVVMRGGRHHVMERCNDCGANARGPGVWVAQSTLPSDLPVFQDLRTPEEKGEQGLLF